MRKDIAYTGPGLVTMGSLVRTSVRTYGYSSTIILKTNSIFINGRAIYCMYVFLPFTFLFGWETRPVRSSVALLGESLTDQRGWRKKLALSGWLGCISPTIFPWISDRPFLPFLPHTHEIEIKHFFFLRANRSGQTVFIPSKLHLLDRIYEVHPSLALRAAATVSSEQTCRQTLRERKANRKS